MQKKKKKKKKKKKNMQEQGTAGNIAIIQNVYADKYNLYLLLSTFKNWTSQDYDKWVLIKNNHSCIVGIVYLYLLVLWSIFCKNIKSLLIKKKFTNLQCVII